MFSARHHDCSGIPSTRGTRAVRLAGHRLWVGAEISRGKLCLLLIARVRFRASDRRSLAISTRQSRSTNDFHFPAGPPPRNQTKFQPPGESPTEPCQKAKVSETSNEWPLCPPVAQESWLANRETSLLRPLKCCVCVKDRVGCSSAGSARVETLRERTGSDITRELNKQRAAPCEARSRRTCK